MPSSEFNRLDRPLKLTARVEQLLREAIAQGRFPDRRLPTESELAEQFGVSRETVRLAAETLQQEGLLVKIRRRGTFLNVPEMPEEYLPNSGACLAYLQAGYLAKGPADGQEDAATRSISGLMLQGALESASAAGFRLVAQHARHTEVTAAFRQLRQDRRIRGVMFAHFGGEKLLRRATSLSIPVVVLDHDVHASGIHSVRDDSFEGARLAIAHLIELGHRRIAFANWSQTELNPWRLDGYRRGLRDAGVPRRRAWELAAELTPAGADAVVRQLLSLAPRPTAIYCFNNTLARLVIASLDDKGVKVPDNMSVVGAGGEDVPSLTCNQADWAQLGRCAVAMLLEILNADQPPPPKHLLVQHSLHLGHSTAPHISAIENRY